MKAGQELDALIHEKVMGLSAKPILIKGVGRGISLKPGAINSVYDFVRPAEIPYYSTDIAVAWPIAEMFQDKGDYKIEISSYANDKLWTIKAYHKDGHAKSCTTSAETLPLAICLAALKAVEKR